MYVAEELPSSWGSGGALVVTKLPSGKQTRERVGAQSGESTRLHLVYLHTDVTNTLHTLLKTVSTKYVE